MYKARGKHARPVRRVISASGVVLAAVMAAVLGLTMAGAASAATAVYLNSPGWTTFTRDTGSLSIDGTHGAPAGFGTSALALRTPLNNDKAQFWSPLSGSDADTALADVSYWTYRTTDSTGASHLVPAINVDVDVNGAAEGGFTTLVFEPVYQAGGAAAVQSGAWQSWEADGAAKWWSTRDIPGVCAFNCFVPLSGILVANPDAVVQRYGINQGGGNPGLTGASDGLTIDGQTFDFQTTITLEGKDECKDGGWTTSIDPAFVNQGDCVSYFVSHGATHG